MFQFDWGSKENVSRSVVPDQFLSRLFTLPFLLVGSVNYYLFLLSIFCDKRFIQHLISILL